jgi:hypothetical protein
MIRLPFAFTLALCSLLLVAAPAHADRAATASERPQLLGATHLPECVWPKMAVRISTVDPRWGKISARTHRGACLLGDGYFVMRRASRTSTKWRTSFEGSSMVGCEPVSERAIIDLLDSCLLGRARSKPFSKAAHRALRSFYAARTDVEAYEVQRPHVCFLEDPSHLDHVLCQSSAEVTYTGRKPCGDALRTRIRGESATPVVKLVGRCEFPI